MAIENSGDEFEQFVNAGEVEVGDSNAGIEVVEDGQKPAAKSRPPKEAVKPAAAAEESDTSEEETDAGEEDGEEEEKPKKTAKDHQIERLKREKAALARQLREGGSTELATRLAALESRLTTGNGNDTQNAAKEAPDPTDADKYPLGHLDDRYIEDKLDWLADQKATKQADAVLQRQQENERIAAFNAAQTALQDKVDDLAAKGSELFEDFQESVVEAGMRGDYDLSQPTFEAAAEADNGVQILYELSQDPKEASRVAKLSPLAQLKFVLERDAEISGGKKPRTKPQAGEPAKTVSKGANSKTQINPATENLDDFEKAWKQDEKASSR